MAGVTDPATEISHTGVDHNSLRPCIIQDHGGRVQQLACAADSLIRLLKPLYDTNKPAAAQANSSFHDLV